MYIYGNLWSLYIPTTSRSTNILRNQFRIKYSTEIRVIILLVKYEEKIKLYHYTLPTILNLSLLKLTQSFPIFSIFSAHISSLHFSGRLSSSSTSHDPPLRLCPSLHGSSPAVYIYTAACAGESNARERERQCLERERGRTGAVWQTYYLRLIHVSCPGVYKEVHLELGFAALRTSNKSSALRIERQ